MDNRFHFAKLFSSAVPRRSCPSASAVTMLRANCGQIIGRLGVGTLLLACWTASLANARAQESAEPGTELGSEPGDVTWALAEDPPLLVLRASYEKSTTTVPARPADPTHVAQATGSLAADEPTYREQAGFNGRSRPQDNRPSAAAPLALAPSKRPLPVEPRSRAATQDVRGNATRWSSPGLFGALALVLGGTAAALWFGKRVGSPRRGRLPIEVFEQLGKASLSPKLEAYLLRVGGKLVLVGVQAGEATPLTEITDPVEVQGIIAACASGGSAYVGNSLADASLDSPLNGAGRDGDSGGRSSFAASLRRSLAQLETRNA